jgi:hypothetical protein
VTALVLAGMGHGQAPPGRGGAAPPAGVTARAEAADLADARPADGRAGTPPTTSRSGSRLPRAPRVSLVRAPVRIADAAAVRLLRPGDRVDVLAASRVVARDAVVVGVPAFSEAGRRAAGSGGTQSRSVGAGAGMPPADDPGLSLGATSAAGALVVLRVSRGVAAALSGAAADSPLGVVMR